MRHLTQEEQEITYGAFELKESALVNAIDNIPIITNIAGLIIGLWYGLPMGLGVGAQVGARVSGPVAGFFGGACGMIFGLVGTGMPMAGYGAVSGAKPVFDY